MTSQQRQQLTREQARYETRDRHDQTLREVAALAGDLGPAAQLTAMSELYKELRAAGKLAEAAAVKSAAIALRAKEGI